MQSQTGSLTATGSVTLTKPLTDTLTTVQISGTYGTVQFVIEGSIDTQNWFAINAVREDTGAVVTSTISPSDNSTAAWKVGTEGLAGVRARVTAIASGTATFALQSHSYVGSPFTYVVSTGSVVATNTTFQAGITFSGASTVNTLSMPDNLADALNIVEGANSYVKFVTTDSSEQIVVSKGTTFAAGLTFSGATTVNKLNLTDNLADALNITEGANSYLKFVTTNSAETVTVTPLLTLTAGASFVGGTGTNLLKMTDNLANALDVTEGSNSYVKFVTTNSAEAVLFGKAFGSTPATVQDIATGNTITLPAGRTKRLTATGGAATGVILTPGIFDGQELVLFNVHATNNITMAAAGTSNVADGTGTVITALTASQLVWDATSARWYETK